MNRRSSIVGLLKEWRLRRALKKLGKRYEPQIYFVGRDGLYVLGRGKAPRLLTSKEAP